MKGERGGSGPLNYQNLRKTLKFLHLQKLQLNSITSFIAASSNRKLSTTDVLPLNALVQILS